MNYTINRKGTFAVNQDQANVNQCGTTGVRIYEYDVTISSTRQLNDKGFLVDREMIDDYFQTTYKEDCRSCEVMCKDAVNYFDKMLSNDIFIQEIPWIKSITVRILGDNYGYVEATNK